MTVKVTALLENTSETGLNLVAKHGLSLYIQTQNQKIIFDTGPDDSSLQNARELGIDLSDAGALVISHSHYDHGGALEDFLKNNDQLQVYLSPYAQNEYYKQKDSGEFEDIGINREVLEKYKGRVHYITEKTEIVPGINLLPVTEHSTFKPKAILYQKQDGTIIRDDYKHELIMTLEEAGKMHVLTGCSHNGIINMVLSAKKIFPEKKISTLIGGFHLMNTNTGGMGEEEATVKEIAYALRDQDITNIITGHCTGMDAFNVLHSILGDRIQRISTGKSFMV